MGFFSWLTADTEETIWNKYTEEGNREVYLCLPDNTTRKFIEYGGYGNFINPDGTCTDVHVLLAEWHEHDLTNLSNEEKRDIGVNIHYGKLPAIYFLKFSFNPNARYSNLPRSEDCPNQGYFGGASLYGW